MNETAQGMRQINRAVRTAIAFDRLGVLNDGDYHQAALGMRRCPYDWGSSVLLVTAKGDHWRIFYPALN